VAEQLTGWPLAEARGRALHEVFHISSLTGQAVEALGLSEGTEPGMARSIVLTTREGLQVSVEDNTAPIRDADGGLTGIVVLLRL
jgi:PAS domain S-box-containing protein